MTGESARENSCMSFGEWHFQKNIIINNKKQPPGPHQQGCSSYTGSQQLVDENFWGRSCILFVVSDWEGMLSDATVKTEYIMIIGFSIFQHQYG